MIFHSASLCTVGVDKRAGAKDGYEYVVPVGARVTLGNFSQLYPQISQPLLAVKETSEIRFFSFSSGAHEPCLKLIHPPTK